MDKLYNRMMTLEEDDALVGRTTTDEELDGRMDVLVMRDELESNDDKVLAGVDIAVHV